ncbi:MAG: thiosulfate oxidation carrier complex protein SoxZ [Hyphomicrobiales bacterium]|nr:thiosulfate oxidation carrier complex protein SoxZ [Hyphomicrobiales bacterium]MDE2017867.1 thiosulfate oxidation carrier complex protein SoxZ [Hyphomicrobiales bacterium]
MAGTIRAKAAIAGDVTTVQVLIHHPMDSGFVKDAAGKVVPAHFIETLVFSHSGKTLFAANWGPAVSKDPYLKFQYKGGAKGDVIDIAWKDNEGQTDKSTVTVS